MSRLYRSWILRRKIDPFVPSFPKEMESSIYLCGLSDSSERASGSLLLFSPRQTISIMTAGIGYRIFAKGSVMCARRREKGDGERSVDPADSVSACEHLRRDGLHASCVIIIAHCILRSPEFKPIFLLFSSLLFSFLLLSLLFFPVGTRMGLIAATLAHRYEKKEGNNPSRVWAVLTGSRGGSQFSISMVKFFYLIL